MPASDAAGRHAVNPCTIARDDAAARRQPGRPRRCARARRLHGLTGLRFFAAAWVFAYHFLVLTVADAPWWTARLQNAGHAAVSLFFVLSGFVLAYNYAAPLADRRVTRARFWWLRLARVWPLYVLVALVEVPLALHAGVAPARIGAATAADVVGLQAWIPAITFVGNTPGWSVSVELFFYVAFPWLASLAATGERRARAAVPAASCCDARGGGHAGAGAGGERRGDVLEVRPAPAAARVRRRRGARAAVPRAPSDAGAGGGERAGGPGARSPSSPSCSAPAPCRATSCTRCCCRRSRCSCGRSPRAARASVRRPPLRLLGEASYGLYLLQMPLFAALGGKYEWPLAGMVGFFAALVALSIAVALRRRASGAARPRRARAALRRPRAGQRSPSTRAWCASAAGRCSSQ